MSSEAQDPGLAPYPQPVAYGTALAFAMCLRRAAALGAHLDIDARRPRIIILRALQLGDMLNSVPALRAIRQHWPAAHVGLIGLPWARAFARRFGEYVDEHIPFPGFPGLNEEPVDVTRLPRFFADMVARSWDTSIQMHGDGRVSNSFVALLGARSSVGFHLAGHWQPNENYGLYPDSLSERERQLALLRPWGIEASDVSLEFPVRDEDRLALDRIAPALAGPIACLHPGARDARRRWHPVRFASVGDSLAAKGFQIVLTGTDAEMDVVGAVESAMGAPVFNACGLLDLGSFAALVERARVVVSNDTGAAHLARAIGTPSTTIFVASDPTRWGPLPAERARHRVVRGNENSSQDQSEVAVSAVLAEVGDLLERGGMRAA
jgi:ADP-heptose:LPS heptosyltransferase